MKKKHITKHIDKLKKKDKSRLLKGGGILLVAVIGTILLFAARAATFQASVEPENGTLAGCATKVTDSSASNGAAVKFCSPASTTSAGAHIPITYALSSLTGTVRYVATNGNDSNAGTSTAPYATVAKAVSASAANDSIVVKGGEYRDQRNVGLSKSGLHIIAASGETPIFNGSQAVSSSSGWTTEGSYKYRSYTPRPLADGGGLAFGTESTTNNLNGDAVGIYPDQAWIGQTPQQQVRAKSSLADGKFFVDRSNNRIYFTANDAAKSGIEISRSGSAGDKDRLFDIGAANITIEGLTIKRYSPNAGDYGVMTVEASANNAKLKNVSVADLPFDGIDVAAGNTGTTFQNLSIDKAGWQGINTNQTDGFTLDAAKITNMDYFDEFSGSPASGALKTSRNRNTTVTNGVFSDNKSQGLWFDQSNINTIAANNTITNSTNAGVFFEISDGLTFVNNYVKSNGSQPFKAVGSGGVVLVNNTFVGGIDPVGIYTDPRSLPGCASGNPVCQISSDIQTRYPRPATMDWMPRLDMMVNNILAYPSATQYCGLQPLCFTTTHSSGGNAPINTIIHKADSSRGIPQTIMDGNVYVNGTGTIIRVSVPSVNYTSLAAWTAAMAGSPVSIPGIDANGKAGNSWVNADGSPTSALAAVHSQAAAVPSSNAKVNVYVPAGTKHYGVLNK